MTYQYIQNIYHKETSGSTPIDFQAAVGKFPTRLSASECELIPDTLHGIPEWNNLVKQQLIELLTNPVLLPLPQLFGNYVLPKTLEQWNDLGFIQSFDCRVKRYPIGLFSGFAQYGILMELNSDLENKFNEMSEECFLALCSLLMEAIRYGQLSHYLSKSERVVPHVSNIGEIIETIYSFLETLYEFLENKEFTDNDPKKHIRWMIREVFRDQEN